MSERISGGGSDRRARRAWGGLTVAVAGFAAAVAFMNGAFVGSAGSAGLESGPAWPEALAAGSRQAVTVPGDYPTLQRAIDAVADGTTILVAPGTYAERIELRGRTLHLWGVGGASLTRLVGDGTEGPVACVRGGSVRFDGIAFQGGQGESGRGLWVQSGAARLGSCRFESNRGGLGARGAEVSLFDCELDGNRATLAGGAVQGEDAEVRLDRCTIRDNVALTFGGAISLHGGSLQMQDTVLAGNRVSSGAWGGGLYAEGAEIQVERGSFEANASAEAGAGAYLLGGSAELRDVRFDRNRCESGRSVHGEQADIRFIGGGTDDEVAGAVGALADARTGSLRRHVPAGRGTMDDCSAARGTLVSDCNDNGLDDACEMRNGLAMDLDGDGLIDSCQARQAEATALAAAEPEAP